MALDIHLTTSVDVHLLVSEVERTSADPSLQPTGKSIDLSLVQAIKGAKGDKGDRGESGQLEELPDFTLIFENGLI